MSVLGLLDKDNVIKYQLVSYRLLIRILTNHPTVDVESLWMIVDN